MAIMARFRKFCIGEKPSRRRKETHLTPTCLFHQLIFVSANKAIKAKKKRTARPLSPLQIMISSTGKSEFLALWLNF